MADLAEWKKGLEDLRQKLDTPPDVQGSDGRTEQLRVAFGAMAGWDANRSVFTIGQLDADAVIEACREGFAPWWQALAGSVYFGDPGRLEKFHGAMEENRGKGADKVDLSTTMTWGAWDFSIVEGVPPRFSPEALGRLFDWGADPGYKDYNGETYFVKALRGSPAGIIRVFLDHGAPVPAAVQASDQLVAAGNHAQALRIQEALGLGGFYAKVDDRTLMETKYIREAGRNSVFRTLFNFGAQRVTEVFEPGQGGAAMTGYAFDDYDQAALAGAKKKLEKLGGHPEMSTALIDKPKKPKLAAGQSV